MLLLSQARGTASCCVACSPGNLACHTCGNPTCINPMHLGWGSVKDNCEGRKSRRKQMAKNLGSYADKGAAQSSQPRFLDRGHEQAEHS